MFPDYIFFCLHKGKINTEVDNNNLGANKIGQYRFDLLQMTSACIPEPIEVIPIWAPFFFCYI